MSSRACNAKGGHPTPLSVQPFWYSEQGFPDLLEIQFQHCLDAVWFEAQGVERGEAFGEVPKGTVDEIVAEDLGYRACFQDWTMLRYWGKETGWVQTLLSYAHAQEVDVLSNPDFYQRMRALKARGKGFPID